MAVDILKKIVVFVKHHRPIAIISPLLACTSSKMVRC